MIIASPLDYREEARRKLPRFLFDYLDGGAGAETTLKRNENDLSSIALRQKVLTGTSAVNLKTMLFGESYSLPIILAPVGLTGMFARRGEIQAARAAKRSNIPFCLSTVSVCSIQEVVQGSASPIWFQLYVIRDRGFMKDLIANAKTAGCTALVFTVDMPLPGVRYRDKRSGMSGAHSSLTRYCQAMTRPSWAWDVGIRGRPHTLGNIAPRLGQKSGMEDFMGWLAANFDPTVNWRDLEAIRALWDGPLIIKGILDREDALQAAAIGVDGIVVSNHGGRQLDGADSTAKALPYIVDAVGDRLTVLADSGVRCGTDVVKMLALGAKAVMLGRAWVYALTARGEAGVTELLEMFEREIHIAMTLTGRTDIASLSREILSAAISDVAP